MIMKMRCLPLLAAALLAGCGNDYTEKPIKVCDARDIQSGDCTESHYVCTKPMTMWKLYGGPICAMDDPTFYHPSKEPAK